MNALRRGLRVLASSATSTEHIVLRPSTFILQSYSTATTTRRRWKPLDKSSPPSKDITLSARPSEIPFQPKLANSVDLIGHVHTPVQFQTSPDGIPWAATVLTREDSSDFSHLWIPVIFEGDLAHVAACHLKQNDWIHIAGKISADPSYLNENQGQSNVQVMVQSLHFIQGYPLMKNISAVSKQEQISSTSASEKLTNPSGKDLHSKQSEKNDIDESWNDLLSNPNEWWDVRPTEDYLEGAAFERKKNGELLFIDNSTPKWLQEKLQSMIINRKPDLKGSKNSTKNNSGSLLSSWRDLLDDPKQWWDCRDRKHNGLLNPRYPDFKRKDGSLSLWLNKAPKWVLSELEGLDFDVQTVKSKQAKERKGDEFWRDVVENPNKWWDNRSNKSNKKAPDFKHKETGEGLWLDNSPSWVLSKLPPLKAKQEETDRRQTIVS